MPMPCPLAVNSAKRLLMPCTRSPRRRSRLSAAWLSHRSVPGGDQNRVQIPRGGQRHSAAGHQRSSAGSTCSPCSTKA
jgi:hypothetical protein